MVELRSRRFDAVLFDLGGTLMYFRGQWAQVIQQSDAAMMDALQASGISLDSQPFLGGFHDRLRKYDDECGPEFIEYTMAHILKEMLGEYGVEEVPGSLLEEVLKSRFAVSQSYWEVEADALPTLQTLQERGYRMGLISNAGNDADVQALIEKAGIRPFFQCIITSAARGLRKPNPRIFHETLHQLGGEPGRAAMVGDTLGADILGAQNAGITSIWITRRADVPANHAHRNTIHPDLIIERLSELPGLLEKQT
jgi:HAD superfamily hydrolase (TIGR01662 family)